MSNNVFEQKIKEARDRVEEYFLIYYGVKLDDLEIITTPGYWQDKTPTKYICGRPIKATYAYFDSYRDRKGRFTSPYLTWKLLFEAEHKKCNTVNS